MKRCLSLAALLLLLCAAAKHNRFGDIYDCFVIIDAEVSERGADYEQVDYEELLSIVSHARLHYISFEPRWQVNLYDDEGVRYHLYVSRNGTFLRIDSNLFRLSSRKAKKLRKLLEFSSSDSHQ